jgi:hypothetical protein
MTPGAAQVKKPIRFGRFWFTAERSRFAWLPTSYVAGLYPDCPVRDLHWLWFYFQFGIEPKV